MQAVTDHHITNLGQNRLALLEVDGTGEHLVTARRDGLGSPWVVSSGGALPDEQVTDIHTVVDVVMPNHALAVLRGAVDAEGKPITGYSAWVPHGVRKLDGDASFDAWHESVGRPALT